MRKQGKETNTHIMNECTHIACTGPRGKIASKNDDEFNYSEQGGNYDLQDVMCELYNVSEAGP